MNNLNLKDNKGQTLVMVALLLVVLLIFLALAIDVGNLYSERRRMQNAADAGALAGAREICLWPKICGGDWACAAQEYAVTRNGAQAAQVTLTGKTVTVSTTVTVDTFFAGLIGFPTVDVGAVAAAACGEATTTCGLWPIGFAKERWNSFPCGIDFYVWAGDKANNNPDCLTEYYCDLNGDEIDDVLTMHDRMWLDFSDLVDLEHPDDCLQPGCGTAELACWIESTSGAEVSVPYCIAGDPGVRAGIKDEVDSRSGDTLGIPIYEDIGCGGVTCPGSSIEGEEFGCIEVIGWIQSLELLRQDGANPPWKDKVIHVIKSCDQTCVTNCGSTSGG